MIDYLEHNNIKFKENVKIGEITGMNQKRIIPIVAYPSSIEELIGLIKHIRTQNISYEVLGGLSNTYLCNSFYRDIIVITTRVKDILYGDNSFEVACGYNLTKLSRELSKKGIAGYEGFIGIPGTIGAASINNSGAFNSSMHTVVKSVKVLVDEKIIIITNKDLNYRTRSSLLKYRKDYIVISVILDISKRDEISKINKRIEYYSEYRKKYIDGKKKSLGSVFVSTSLRELYNNNKIAFTFKKLCNYPLKLIFHSKKINTFMDFLFLGKPQLAQHCDSLNRFVWDEKTTEDDLFDYIDFMQDLANNKLELEIDIKR